MPSLNRLVQRGVDLEETTSKIRQTKPQWSESSLDQLAENQRYSTWGAIEKGCRGPAPYPSWIIEDAAAIDTELGVLKTGKEGEVFLIERATEHHAALLAAKRYRSYKHLQFTRSQTYSEGRSARRSRDNRAMERGTRYGRDIAAQQWASAEWTYLRRCFEAGVPVPYPVQIDGTEILMEFINDPSSAQSAAPRLAQLPRNDSRLPVLWEQLVDAMEKLAGIGLAHGDLSAYNILVRGERLVLIDLPQCIDLAGNLQSFDFLHRDCQNVADWFASRGHEQDPDELLSRLLASMY